jgi:phage recombination protein Bet
MAGRYNVEPAKLLETLKGTVFKGASNEELMALVVVANEYQLNPFTRQIYAFPAKSGGITPVVSIDGWIAVMNRRDDFDGIEFEMLDKDGKPFSCTAIVRVKGRANPVKVTEYFDECFRNTDPWRAMPRRMLRHKACAQGVRLAFGLAGCYDEDEARAMAALDPVANAKPAKAAPPEPQFVAQLTDAAPAQADDQVPGAEVPPTPTLDSRPKSQGSKFKAQTPVERDLKTLRLLLQESSGSEAALLALWRNNGVIDESLASLEEVAEIKPSAIRAACDPWAKTLALLNEAKKGVAQ